MSPEQSAANNAANMYVQVANQIAVATCDQMARTLRAESQAARDTLWETVTALQAQVAALSQPQPHKEARQQ